MFVMNRIVSKSEDTSAWHQWSLIVHTGQLISPVPTPETHTNNFIPEDERQYVELRLLHEDDCNDIESVLYQCACESSVVLLVVVSVLLWVAALVLDGR